MSQTLPPLIVVDIGGTNLRIATLADLRLVNIESVQCTVTNPETAIAHYMDTHGLAGAVLCMAIASPVTGDRVQMTNFDWSFTPAELQQRLGLMQLFIINDFHAMSLSVPNLGPEHLVVVGDGEPDAARTRVICGPGTGMGLAHLLPHGDDWVVMSGEGGHGDVAPNSELEARIWQVIHRREGHVYVESLLSGPGLVKLYGVLCELEGLAADTLTAAEISSRAIQNEDPRCSLALTTFCEMFGSWCGSIAINAGAFAGVYIAGGMIPKFLDFFLASPFRHRFDAKGSYSFYTARIPVYVITHTMPGLLGAAEYLRGELCARGLDLSRAQIRIMP